MNRRSFFRSLSSAVAGVYIACHVNVGKLTGSVCESIRPESVAFNPLSYVGDWKFETTGTDGKLIIYER